MEYPWNSPYTAPFPQMVGPPPDYAQCVDPKFSSEACPQCDCKDAGEDYAVPECCQGLPSFVPLQPPLAVPDLGASIMEDMNAQMRAMEDNMQRMQQHMQEQFSRMNMGGTAPGTMPQPPLIGNMSTMPRMPNMFPKMQDFSSATLPRKKPSATTAPINGPSSVHDYYGATLPRNKSVPYKSTSSPGSSSIYVKGPYIQPPSPSPIPPSPGFLTPDPMGNCITEGDDGCKQLKLQFDMQAFKPEEIQVKKDRNRLEVHAHHEDKQPDRISCRVFHQQYDLPKDVRLTKVNTRVTPDGYLTVQSPVKPRHRVHFATEDQRGRLKCQVQDNRFPTQ